MSSGTMPGDIVWGYMALGRAMQAPLTVRQTDVEVGILQLRNQYFDYHLLTCVHSGGVPVPLRLVAIHIPRSTGAKGLAESR